MNWNEIVVLSSQSLMTPLANKSRFEPQLINYASSFIKFCSRLISFWGSINLCLDLYRLHFPSLSIASSAIHVYDDSIRFGLKMARKSLHPHPYTFIFILIIILIIFVIRIIISFFLFVAFIYFAFFFSLVFDHSCTIKSVIRQKG